ncbi:guanylate cyclase soluble subunit beta-1-like [Ornithodoros turicata]|uniref:guanylate cyclase soluble subunit beta-1-like n=1 Tax=Ornithodoros turicata TaxID=34597 RepID=UPI003138B555
MHRVYADDVTMKLVQSASEVLEMSKDSCLEALGCHFLFFCQQHGYDKILRVLGSNLTDFLTNLDNLHDHLAGSYPGMSAPSFRVTPGPLGSIHLHYCSQRRGLHPIVKGLVKTVAGEFFDTEVTVNTCKIMDEGDKVIVLMEVSEVLLKVDMPELLPNPFGMQKRSSFTSAHITDHLSQQPQDLPVDVKTFCSAFPFHVMFDRDFNIRQVGKGLLRLTKSMWTKGKPVKFTDMFTISRPVIECTFESILGFLNQVYVVVGKEGVLEKEHKAGHVATSSNVLPGPRKILRRLNSTLEPPPDGILRLKGQMVSVPESDCILFLCSPRVKGLDDMLRIGLHFSDLAIHDPVRNLILISHHRKGERELVDKLDEASNNLKVLDAKLREDKRRTEDLLCSIFPARVAKNLCQDLPVEAEMYELVSCLFSDIVGFTTLCGNENIQPMDIVRLLNRLYVQFDALTGVHGVYKVETIGDAYVVVSGIPELTDDHADRLVAMGLAMQAVTRTIISPVEGHPIEIRTGIHSGPAMAGVVGVQMPRYCLFGHTVTLANKIESRGLSSHVNISETTKSYLIKDGYQFTENADIGDLEVKCYYVTRPSDSDSSVSDPATLGVALYGGGGHFRSPTGSPVHSERPTPVGSRSSSTHSSSPIVSPLNPDLVTASGTCSTLSSLRRKIRRAFNFPPVDTPSPTFPCPSEGTETDELFTDPALCVIQVESASSHEPSLSSGTLSSRTSPCVEQRTVNKTTPSTVDSPRYDQPDIAKEDLNDLRKSVERLCSFTASPGHAAEPRLVCHWDNPSSNVCPFTAQDMNRNLQEYLEIAITETCESKHEAGDANVSSTAAANDPTTTITLTSALCNVPTTTPTEETAKSRCISGWRKLMRRHKRSDKTSSLNLDLHLTSKRRSSKDGLSLPATPGCPMQKVLAEVMTTTSFGDNALSSPGNRTQSCYSFNTLEDRHVAAVKKKSTTRFGLPHFNLHFPKIGHSLSKSSIFSRVALPSSR